MRHLSSLSCGLAILAIAAWPVFNTMLVPWLAASAVTTGCVAAFVRRETVSRATTALSVAGLSVGGIVLLCWAVVMLLAWSAATGSPL